MKNHIAAHAAKSVIAAMITAVCFGSVAVPYFAASAAPAGASAAAHTTISRIVPNDTNWPGP
jgi:hypothetical protein